MLPTIHVIGLGPGDFASLPAGSLTRLQSGLPVFLRTEIHPVVKQLHTSAIPFQSFDHLYDSGQSFEDVYRQMVEALLQAARQLGDIVYAVPGHPLVAERTVQWLRAAAKDVEIVIGPGQSFIDPLCSALHLDPIEGLVLLDGTALAGQQLQPRHHTMIAQVFSRAIASDVKLTLMDLYPDDYPIHVVRAAGIVGEERIVQIPLFELDRLGWVDHLTTVHVPPTSDERILARDPWRVAELVQRLRLPDGCPWDRAQTHVSLRPYVLEEAYEVAHAIDAASPDELAAELGDLYLQILLHAQIGHEAGDFTLRDVWQALADKLIRRHPHVFGEAQAASAEDAERMWRMAKASESGARTTDPSPASVLDLVKQGQPALRVAAELQERAAQVGFDWARIDDVLDKVREELLELAHESSSGAREGMLDEYGDVLFSVVNLSRWLQVDADQALAYANQKFEQRFRYVERRVTESSRSWNQMSLSELDELWMEAKMHIKSS